MQQFTIICPCLFGLEGLAADEAREIGAQQVRAENGRILLEGDVQMLARANLWLRCAERVEILVGSFPARTFDELFEGVKALDWARWIGQRDAFPVKGWSISSQLASIPDCQSIVKKAVVESLKQHYPVQWLEESGPVCQIRFSILKDQVSVMLDTSGAPLHKRGYREQSAGAPLKETLAAAMARLARFYEDSTVYDPFCGSGTILIESAMLARNIAPGLRRRFACERWDSVGEAPFRSERERAIGMIRNSIAFTARGSDLDPAAVELTMHNAKLAGVDDCVSAHTADIAEFVRDSDRGIVITNPPYGERLLDLREAERLYGVMGQRFAVQRGWRYHIITPHEQFEQLFGRRADKRRKLYNGMIRCQLYQYFKSV